MSIVDLECLINFATQIGVQIHYIKLRNFHPELLGYTKPPNIYLDSSLMANPKQHKCVLAEEIGHVFYPPLPGHASYHMNDYYKQYHWQRDNLAVLVAKDERYALKWGTSFLIPDKHFWEFANAGPHEWWEWLEHFEVEDWFMQAKVEYMRVKHPFKWREIIKKNATG